MAKDRSLSPARGGLSNARHPFSRRVPAPHEHGPTHRPSLGPPHCNGRPHHAPADLESPPPVGAAPHAAVAAADARAAAADSDDEHEHYAHRAPWLRAGVLGANDGLVSTASLMLGVGGGR